MELLATFLGKRMDKVEEMLKRVMPEIGIEQGEMLKYTEERLDEVGCKDLATAEMYNEKDWLILGEFCIKDPIMAILYALCIGFANGVKWERK